MRKLLLIAFVVAPMAVAQTAQSSPTLEALLAEVRQLRLAIERSAILGPKIQLAVQRLSLQDQKIARISSELDNTRREIADRTEGQQRIAQQIANLEQRLAGETDPARRKELEIEREHMKSVPSQPMDPRLTAREAELANSLQREQSVVQEINGKLEALERFLDEGK
jgi:chromosome segregation ATPase